MTPPFAEVSGIKGKLLVAGDVEVSYEDGEVLLFPTEQKAADTLNKTIKDNLGANITFTEHLLGDLTVEGSNTKKVIVDTKRARVLDPVAG